MVLAGEAGRMAGGRPGELQVSLRHPGHTQDILTSHKVLSTNTANHNHCSIVGPYVTYLLIFPIFFFTLFLYLSLSLPPPLSLSTA